MTARQWSELVQEQSPLVWRTAYRLLASQADAADCMQETFLAGWAYSRRETVRNWPALLQRLATARALDQLRRRLRLRGRVQETNMAAVPSRGGGPAREAQLAELAGQLREALGRLPEKQSTIYCLRHLNDMSYEEIAAELNMSVGAVGVTLHRATEQLRVLLAPVFTEGPLERRMS